MDKLLDKEWRSLAEQALADPTISTMDRMFARRFFYAGARSITHILETKLEPGDDMTERDEETFRGLEQELDEFIADVEAGRA